MGVSKSLQNEGAAPAIQSEPHGFKNGKANLLRIEARNGPVVSWQSGEV
jgi:hypothetical protein